MIESPSDSGEILVVDDEEPIRRYLSRILTLAGYSCATAGSAAEADALLSNRPFALALCDLSLPDLPGIDFIRYVAAHHPRTATVIVTGTDDPAVARDAIENGAYGYVVKPFQQNEILITVHTSLRRRRLELDVMRSHQELENQVAVRTSELSQVVADLRQTTEDLRRRDERFRSLAECTPAVILLLDQEGRCVFANAAARELVDGPMSRLTGDGWRDIVHPGDADRFLTWLEVAARGNDEQFFELRVVTSTRSVRWLRARVAPSRGDDNRLTGFVVAAEDVTEQRAASRKLQRLARTDHLTGLPNRAVLLARLTRVMADPSHVRSHAILFVDLDRFKLVNDTYGHIIGDRVLKVVGHRLSEVVGDQAMVSRLGGDEFVILAEDVSSPRQIIRLAERINEAIRAPMSIEGREFRIGAAVGIAFTTSGGGEAEKVLGDADIALSRAKGVGGNGYEIYDETMRRQMTERLQLESRLRGALEREQLRLVYQPEFRMDGRLAGFEALLRWDDPELGSVPPSDFVPVAEQSGLIVPLGRWVLEQAAAQARSWNPHGAMPVMMSVNLSAIQVRDPLLVRNVADTLQWSGLQPGQLCLEITETVVMDDVTQTMAVCEELRGLGVQLAVDDFGTGYSSLSYLADLPLDYLKVDRSFVSGAGARPKNESILGAVITMAHGLGLTVIAEGVESSEQLEWLSARGCDIVQGFMLGRPLSPKQCGRWLEGLSRDIPGQLRLAQGSFAQRCCEPPSTAAVPNPAGPAAAAGAGADRVVIAAP